MFRLKTLLIPLGMMTAMIAASHAAGPPPPPALPDYTNPGFANPDTPGLLDGKPADNVPNTVDINFLKQLAIGSQAEVALGKLAGERGSEPIKGFGKRMVDDHSAANSKLASLARAARVELPDKPDAKHEAVQRELSSLQGSAFGMRYLASQIEDHQKAAQLLIHEIGSGQHGGARQFAAQTLPVVMQHLEHARALQEQLMKEGAPARD